MFKNEFETYSLRSITSGDNKTKWTAKLFKKFSFKVCKIKNKKTIWLETTVGVWTAWVNRWINGSTAIDHDTHQG